MSSPQAFLEAESPALPSSALTPTEVNRIRIWEYDFETLTGSHSW